jgi:hypothetical protein
VKTVAQIKEIVMDTVSIQKDTTSFQKAFTQQMSDTKLKFTTVDKTIETLKKLCPGLNTRAQHHNRPEPLQVPNDLPPVKVNTPELEVGISSPATATEVESQQRHRLRTPTPSGQQIGA